MTKFVSHWIRGFVRWGEGRLVISFWTTSLYKQKDSERKKKQDDSSYRCFHPRVKKVFNNVEHTSKLQQKQIKQLLTFKICYLRVIVDSTVIELK